MKSVKIAVLIILVALFIAGCAKAPQEAVDAAKAALENARAGEADRYLADEFNQAQDAFNAAMAEVETQNGKFALTRNYDEAVNGLNSAKMMAEEALAKTGARKEQVKEEAENLLNELNTALTETKKLLKKAPRGKGEKEAVQMIESDLKAVEAGLSDITSLSASGDFMGAKTKAEAGLSKVNSLKAEIQAAIAKKKGR